MRPQAYVNSLISKDPDTINSAFHTQQKNAQQKDLEINIQLDSLAFFSPVSTHAHVLSVRIKIHGRTYSQLRMSEKSSSKKGAQNSC